ncbi:MAG: hypothetical protein ABIT47_02040 [Candidatus Paceibacterota bacterium]
MVVRGSHPYSEDKKLLISLWVAIADIETIEDSLRVARPLLDPEGMDVLVLAVAYLSEKKTNDDGKRDGKKIYEHRQHGLGERLTPQHKIKAAIIIALKEVVARSVIGNQNNKDLRHELKSKRFHAHAVVLDLLSLMDERLRWGDDPPKLPTYLR